MPKMIVTKHDEVFNDPQSFHISVCNAENTLEHNYVYRPEDPAHFEVDGVEYETEASPELLIAIQTLNYMFTPGTVSMVTEHG